MPTLLAVIPHPDDEAYSFAGTIALAAAAGWECMVHCASRGERGKRHDGGPTGEAALGLAREYELATSCALLGAAPPVSWGLPDGGLRDAPSQAARILGLFRELQPDLVLALGPDGAYGHPDHIAVYRWLREAWESSPAPRPALLFAAFPRGLFLPQYEKCIGMMGDPPEPPASAIGSDAAHYSVSIARVREAKLAAIAAHRSQLPGGDPEAIFPPGIVGALVHTECFLDARGAPDPGTAALLASLQRPHQA
ncbi:MAG: PIG-L family deacetylase [Chloroflexi bacterium]|nr:PIG-L family deacetylase [Chloroflexota bacterium]